MSVTNDQRGTSTGTGALLQFGLGTALTIASGTISVDNSMHFVSGSGTLSTINWAAANTPTNPAVLYLTPAPGATWTLDSSGSGNINPITRLPVVNHPLTFVWDGASKWYEVPTIPTTVTPFDFGAKGDGRSVNCSLANGQLGFVLNSGTLTSSDVGKSFVFPGAAGTGEALATTIATVTSSTTGTLTHAPASSPSGTAYIATDDTAAIQAAIDASSSVYLPDAMFGYTQLQLHDWMKLYGSGNGTTLQCVGGDSGPHIMMKSGAAAQGVVLEDFFVRCGQVGVDRNGIELGTETPGTTDFSLGSRITNVQIWDATGVQLRLHVNVASIDNVWCESAYPTVQATCGGAYLTGGVLNTRLLNIEGTYGTTPLRSAAGYTNHQSLQMEVSGLSNSIDVISVEGSNHVFALPYVFLGSTVRDVMRIGSGVFHVTVNGLARIGTTAANLVNDVPNAYTISITSSWVPYYNTDFEFHRLERWTNATLPAAGFSRDDGRYGVNFDTREFVYFMGTGRYKLVGTAF